MFGLGNSGIGIFPIQRGSGQGSGQGGIPQGVFRISSHDPSVNVNPPQTGAVWINATTGEIFTCIDNTENRNIWKSQFGRVIAPSSVPPFDILNDNSCVAYFPFNGNANDVGGNYNGEWGGNEKYIPSGWNQAAFFDGASYINVKQPVNSLPAFSISFWVKTEQSAEGDAHWTNPTMIAIATAGRSRDIGIACKYGNLHIWTGNCANGDVYKTTEFFIANNRWNHIVVAVSSNRIDYYVNKQHGFLDACYDHLDPQDFYVGVTYHHGDSSPFKPTSWFKGAIDNLRFFNKALAQEEVNTIFEIENPYPTSG